MNQLRNERKRIWPGVVLITAAGGAAILSFLMLKNNSADLKFDAVCTTPVQPGDTLIGIARDAGSEDAVTLARRFQIDSGLEPGNLQPGDPVEVSDFDVCKALANADRTVVYVKQQPSLPVETIPA